MVDLSLLNITPASEQTVVLSHQIYMFAVWSLLVELPRLMIRYGKVTANNYLNLHSISMTMFACITIYYAIVMLVMFSTAEAAAERQTSTYLFVHYICAFVLIAMLTVQMVTGVVVRSMVLGEEYTPCMRVMKFVHSISGYLVIAVGRISISFGLLQLNVDAL